MNGEKGAHIGDVIVHRGEPPGGNPYRGCGLMGDERVVALTLFKNGGDIHEYTFWYGPSFGGARRIEAKEVNWETSRIK